MTDSPIESYLDEVIAQNEIELFFDNEMIYY